MSQLRFKHEWLRDLHGESPEIACTFARLEIQVGDAHVTRVEDRDGGGVREGIFVSMYPLAEWIAANWWNLAYEPIVHAVSRAPEDYRVRHNAASAGDGFAWPDLLFAHQGSTVRVSWEPRRVPSMDVAFVEQGCDSLAASEVLGALTRVVDEVVARLLVREITDTPLQKDWEYIRTITADEDAFCRSVASLGLDPLDLDDETASGIERVSASLDPELQDDFFRAVNPAQLEPALDWIRLAAGSIAMVAKGPSNWTRIRERIRLPIRDRAWQAGTELARRARDAAGARVGPEG